MSKPHLFVGNYNYSSWTLRPWLCLTWSGLAFDETLINLNQDGYGEKKIADVLAVSPTGTLPALRLGDETIWDSLAIAEWAAEAAPAARLWPQDAMARAVARSVTCEMHAGFAGIRRDLSMNIRRRVVATGLPAETLGEIKRVDELWCTTRARFGQGGAHLFGHRTIADAFYTPVATRFRTYGIALSASAQAYCDALLADEAFAVWEQRVLSAPATPFARSQTDALYQAR